MPLHLNQRIYLLECYFRTGRLTGDDRWIYSYEDCARQFANQYPHYGQPSKSTINSLIRRYRDSGSVKDKKRPGRVARLTEGILENIRDRVNHSPKKSLRRLSAETGLPLTTCHRAVRKKLKLYPYKISCLQELKGTDLAKRVNYCNWFQQNMTEEQLSLTFFTDEAWIHLSGYVNGQNCRIWSTENPHNYIESPLHSIKIGIWIAISRRRIIGPIFFHETLNTQRYLIIFDEFVNQLTDFERAHCWFQQDSATCHTSTLSMQHISHIFNDRIIRKDLWPPRSPDLTPPDYFLFGALKDKVFSKNPHTLIELQQQITDAIAEITNETLDNVFVNMRKRIQLCLNENGGHFQHLL